MDFENTQLSDIIKAGKIEDSQDSKNNITQTVSQGKIQEMMNSTLGNSLSQISPNSSFLSMKHDSSRRRTPKIELPDYSMNSPNLEMMRDVFNKETNSSLMKSPVSEYAISQKQLGSQPVDILRPKTAEEKQLQLERAKKRGDGAARSCPSGAEFQVVNPIHRVIPETEPMPHLYRNPPDQNEMSQTKTAAIPLEPKKSFDLLEIEVMEGKNRKVSDFGYKKIDGRKHLWTKMACNVPIEVKWKLSETLQKEPKYLKVRFVGFDKKMSLQNAIRNPLTDVIKCRNHIESSIENPPEAFFHVTGSRRSWQWPSKEQNALTGHFYFTEIEPNEISLEFDIKFSCQGKCMGVEEKRKTMCLAVFLEDKNGNEIAHDVISSVRVVAYPRRDMRNFTEHRPSVDELFNFDRPDLAQTESKRMMEDAKNQSMFQVQSQQSRKRLHTNDVTMESVEGSQSTSSASNAYIARLHNCQRKTDIPDSPSPPPPLKRIRENSGKLKNLVLTEELYETAIHLLADHADSIRRQSVSGTKRLHPIQFVSTLTPNTPIDNLVTIIGRNLKEIELFKNNGISKMGDLVMAYEKNPHIFERIGIIGENVGIYLNVFLNYFFAHEKLRINTATAAQQLN